MRTISEPGKHPSSPHCSQQPELIIACTLIHKVWETIDIKLHILQSDSSMSKKRVQFLKEKAQLWRFSFLCAPLSSRTRTDSRLWSERHNMDVCWCIQDVASHKFFGVSFAKPRRWSPRGVRVYGPFAGVNVFTLTLICSNERVTHSLLFLMQLIGKQLAQIIKINTLEAWHYAKETSRF